MNRRDLSLFVLYGDFIWSKNVCPKWVFKLVTCTSLSQFVNVYHLGDNAPLSQSESIVYIQLLFLSFVLTIFKHISSEKTVIQNVFKQMTHNVSWPTLLTLPFNKAILMFMSVLHLNGICFPLVQCNNNILPVLINMKKRHKHDFQLDSSLCVLPPHMRLDEAHLFLSKEISFQNKNEVHDINLIGALQKRASSIPCGNPFNSMIKALTFESLITSKYAVLPDNIELKNSMVYDLYTKIIGYNILCPFFSIPIFDTNVKSCNTKSCEAVVCLECGYCLNFGKGKFKKVSFKPTHIFYCRDQKEKCFTICASSGRIYCSFCGSPRIKSFPMKFYVGTQQYIRAVSASNCSIVVSDSSVEIDVVLPCIIKSCTNTILKRLSVASLFHISNLNTNLYCTTCSKVL